MRKIEYFIKFNLLENILKKKPLSQHIKYTTYWKLKLYLIKQGLGTIQSKAIWQVFKHSQRSLNDDNHSVSIDLFRKDGSMMEQLNENRQMVNGDEIAWWQKMRENGKSMIIEINFGPDERFCKWWSSHDVHFLFGFQCFENLNLIRSIGNLRKWFQKNVNLFINRKMNKGFKFGACFILKAESDGVKKAELQKKNQLNIETIDTTLSEMNYNRSV